VCFVYERMKLRLLAVLSLFVLAACPKTEERDAFFWHITSANVEFGQCTDEAWFRDVFAAPDAGTNTYLIYEVAKDGKTASTLDCTRVSIDYCTTPADPIVWQVEGNELTRGLTFNSVIPDAGCSIQENVTDTITVNDKTMSDATVDVISLVEDTAGSGACTELDTQVKGHSTNGFGLEGCVVTLTVQGEIK
jgi:hypothetical protein